ncbi:hypothetical protein DBV15_01825, partial [Temnothorax longispinosus]
RLQERLTKKRRRLSSYFIRRVIVISARNFYEVAQPHENFWVSRKLTRRAVSRSGAENVEIDEEPRQGSVLGIWAVKKVGTPTVTQIFIFEIQELHCLLEN